MIDPLEQDWIEVFASLSKIPLSCRDKNEALRRINELGRQALRSHGCTLTFVDLENRYVIQVASAGFGAQFDKFMAGKRFRLGTQAPGTFLDYELFARGQEIEKYDLQVDGQGVANPSVAGMYNMNSVLACPLIFDGHLIGYFNHFSAEQRAFAKEEKRLLQIFANQAVIAIKNLENLVDLKRLETLNEIMQQITKARDMDSLLELVLSGALELVGATRGWISRLDFGTCQLSIVAHQGDPSKLQPLRAGEGITGKALKEEHPIRVDDIHDSEWKDIYREYWPDTQSELAVPISISNAEVRVGRQVELGPKWIGAINVESPSRAAFSQADENLLWSLARHSAVMIDRLELDWKVAEVAKVQEEVVGKKDGNDVIQTMLAVITSTLGYDYANISLVEPEMNRIKTKYVCGLSDRDAEEFEKLAVHSLDSNDIQADIVRSRQAEVPPVDDERFDPVIYSRLRHDRLIRVFLPMIAPSDNRVIGTVEAGYRRTFRRYIYEQDVQILKSFVGYAARALELRQRGLLDKICHELRSPLVGIRSNASFLQRRLHELEEGLIQRKFDDILTDTEILFLQIKELEYVLGSVSPASKIEKTLVFRDIVIKTVRQLKPLVVEAGFDAQKIEYDADDIRRVGALYVDKAKLSQVVYNVLLNSIKYAEKDPNLFRIRIVAEEARNAYVIKFKDWGIGIERGFEQRVFEEGFRTPEAIRRNVTGTGLGLTIAKNIMQELGGDLKLVGSLKPTEFHIILPHSLREAPE